MKKSIIIITILFAICAFIENHFDLIQGTGISQSAANLIKTAGVFVYFILVYAFGKPTTPPGGAA